MRDHLELYAREKAASLHGLAGRTIGIHLRCGDVAAELLAVARDVVADLIVVGSSEHPVLAHFSVPTVNEVMQRATCPVLVAGPQLRELVAEPAIEPACETCVACRLKSGGKTWWCARHSTRAAEAHTFSYERELPFETRDSELGPTGA